ncbi:MAG: NAD(P)H-dependent oxidoreductase, partial [Eggerthellaceae bacterium]|nr:NAD(P)H-dependent oxidoreductase [Eggerthellaceae bacterium]
MVLFVNACVRGDKSRTLALCREYLKGVKQTGEIVREVNLELLHLAPLSDQKVAFRSQLARAKRYEDDIFNLSHQFAEADDIVIGAPYWDLSFPAALKTYIEHVSVDGITFRFTPEAHYEGLCTARRITYITTSGSILSENSGECAAEARGAGTS